jgi:hypothetical protein
LECLPIYLFDVPRVKTPEENGWFGGGVTPLLPATFVMFIELMIIHFAE